MVYSEIIVRTKRWKQLEQSYGYKEAKIWLTVDKEEYLSLAFISKPSTDPSIPHHNWIRLRTFHFDVLPPPANAKILRYPFGQYDLFDITKELAQHEMHTYGDVQQRMCDFVSSIKVHDAFSSSDPILRSLAILDERVGRNQVKAFFLKECSKQPEDRTSPLVLASATLRYAFEFIPGFNST